MQKKRWLGKNLVDVFPRIGASFGVCTLPVVTKTSSENRPKDCVVLSVLRFSTVFSANVASN